MKSELNSVSRTVLGNWRVLFLMLAWAMFLIGQLLAQSEPGWNVVKRIPKQKTEIVALDALTDHSPRWEWRSPNLKSMQFLDDDYGWAVGDGGVSVRTIDGGSSWQTGRVIPTANLHAVYFVNNRQGWAAGYQESRKRIAIYHSNDGGKTWRVQKTIQGFELISINAMQFVNERHGWAVGTTEKREAGYGIIFVTEDGGKNWKEQYSDASMNGLLDVKFVSERQGWAIGVDKIVHTEDGGNHWSEQYHSMAGRDDFLFGMDFASPSDGWVIGGMYSAEILRTTNGGKNWNVVAIHPIENSSDPGKRLLCYSIKFDQRSRGIAGCNEGVILSSSNGGESWSVEHTGVQQTIGSLALTSHSSFAAGTKGVILRRAN